MQYEKKSSKLFLQIVDLHSEIYKIIQKMNFRFKCCDKRYEIDTCDIKIKLNTKNFS